MSDASNGNQEVEMDVSKVGAKNAVVWLGLMIAAGAAFFLQYNATSPNRLLMLSMTGITSVVCFYFLVKATVTQSYDPSRDPLAVLRTPTLLEGFLLKVVASVFTCIIAAFFLVKYLGS